MLPPIRSRRLSMVAVVMLALAGAAPAATVWYVSAAATGKKNGTSWADAFTDLQRALDVAQSGHEIWVAAGTYRPSARMGYEPQSATFSLPSGVIIFGGFAGHETAADQRDARAHPVVLSGDLAGDDETTGSRTDNAYRVVSRLDGGHYAILCSVTIRGAGSAESTSLGGGVYVSFYGGHLSLCDCLITDNIASRGAGLAHQSSSNLEVIDTVFRGNQALYTGGAVCVYPYAYGWTGLPGFERCVFEANTALGGGAIAAYGEAAPGMQDCRFVGNSAKSGGAMFLYRSGPLPLTLWRCTFEDNISQGVGGAICHVGGDLDVDRCTFDGNTSLDEFAESGGGIMSESSYLLKISRSTFTRNVGKRGAGVRTQYTTAQIFNCRFLGNTSSDRGGGLYNRMSNVTVANCLFADNVAGPGGGAFDSDSNVTYSNCTFAGNSARTGGGLILEDSTGTHATAVANCIFWGNSDQQGSGENAQIGVAYNPGYPLPNLTVNYSCIQGWTGAMGGEGNFGADPLFVPGDPLYHVRGTSPTLEAGSNALVPADSRDLDWDGITAEPVPLDLDHAPRFKDMPFMPETGAGEPPIVDMGCYEYFIDCDRNGIFDTCDFGCGEAGGPCDVPGCGQEPDCNGNGAIDACEPDTDRDGLIDDCDEDDDNDGVLDESDNCPVDTNAGQADADGDGVGDACDACPRTLPGLPVDDEGCPPAVPGDFDRDGDVDQSDYGRFQACLSGRNVPQTDPQCAKARLNADTWVDAADLTIFLGCMSGPGVPGSTGCAGN